jgi:nitroreductase
MNSNLKSYPVYLLRLRSILKKIYLKLIFFRYVVDDYKHLIYPGKNKAEAVLLANITREYHRIEKGLGHKDFRFGFGQRALQELLRYLKKYFEIDLDNNNARIQTALSVLHQYIEKHKECNLDLSNVKEILKRYGFYEKQNISNRELGGVTSFSSEEILQMRNGNFLDLSRSRHSVRFFSNLDVSVDVVLDAISIAQNSPSVCNRQGWKVRLIKSNEKLDLFRRVHNGFPNSKQNLNCLLVITFRKDFFSYPVERNQGYTDAGLFSMSLLYSLTHKGLATCALNANLTRGNEKLVRKSFNINQNEGLVMFIAVGHYDTIFTSPKSYKDECKDVVDIML